LNLGYTQEDIQNTFSFLDGNRQFFLDIQEEVFEGTYFPDLRRVGRRQFSLLAAA